MERANHHIARRLLFADLSLAVGYALLSLWLYLSSAALVSSVAILLSIPAISGILAKIFSLVRPSRRSELAGRASLIVLWIAYLGAIFFRGLLEVRVLEAVLSLAYLAFLVLSSDSMQHFRTRAGSSFREGTDPRLQALFGKAVSKALLNGFLALLYSSFITATAVVFRYAAPFLSLEYDISLVGLAVFLGVFFILSNFLVKTE